MPPASDTRPFGSPPSMAPAIAVEGGTDGVSGSIVSGAFVGAPGLGAGDDDVVTVRGTGAGGGGRASASTYDGIDVTGIGRTTSASGITTSTSNTTRCATIEMGTLPER